MHNVQSILLHLRKMHIQFKKLMVHMAEEEGLTESLLFSLFKISKECDKVSDLSQYLEVTSGAATGIIDKLEYLQLVERLRLNDDRRVIRIRLTSQGVEKVKKVEEKMNNIYQEIFNDLSSEEFSQIEESLFLMNDTIDQFLNKEKG
jgi:DNA-binding MarR family transcriptional regulator